MSLPRIALAVAAFFAVPLSPSHADTYPSRPITVVVAFPPGGPTDVIARATAAAMQKSLGQQVVVENVSGAGGTIGVGRVARAQGDGYTLLVHHIGMATAPTLYRKLPFDPKQDFIPIGAIADVPMTIVGRADFPAQSFDAMLAYIKSKGNGITYANAGIGSASHLCGLVFMQAIETQFTVVPYKGTQPAMTDLLGGRVDLLCDQTTQTTAQINANKVRAFAATTRERIRTMPNLPTLHELGLKDFHIAIWHVLYAPRNTPGEVVTRLESALQFALKDSAVAHLFKELGTEPVAPDRATSTAGRELLEREIARWEPVIRQAGQYAD